jgi:hypothetical protein
MRIEREDWGRLVSHGSGQEHELSGARYTFFGEGRSYVFNTVHQATQQAIFEAIERDGRRMAVWCGSEDLAGVSAFPRNDPVLAEALEYLRDRCKVREVALLVGEGARATLRPVGVDVLVGAARSEPRDTIHVRIALVTHLPADESIATRPWIDGHLMFLVRDDGLRQVCLGEEEVGARWSELVDEALDNLRVLVVEKTRTRADSDLPGEATTIAFDGHPVVSSFPLLREFDGISRHFLGGDYLFCIPSVDRLVALRESERDRIAAFALEEYETAGHPVSPHVYGSRDGLVEVRVAQTDRRCP